MAANALKEGPGFHKFEGSRGTPAVARDSRDRLGCPGVAFREADYFTSVVSPFPFAPRACRREAEERRGAAAGDEGLLREERDRAGSEAGAEEQRPLAGLAAERARRPAAEAAAEMHRQLVRLPHAADVAVAVAAGPHDAALLLGLVPRAGPT